MDHQYKNHFSKDILIIDDVQSAIETITAKLKDDVLLVTKRKGAVVGISGGIDSSVTLALTVKALGAKNVIGLLLPEKDSSSESKDLALELAGKFGVTTIEENITGALEALGCYRRRDEAVNALFPEYNPITHRMKIGINPKAINQNLPPVFFLTIINDKGESQK